MSAMTRREMLKTTGAAIGGVVLGVAAIDRLAKAAGMATLGRPRKEGAARRTTAGSAF